MHQGTDHPSTTATSVIHTPNSLPTNSPTEPKGRFQPCNDSHLFRQAVPATSLAQNSDAGAPAKPSLANQSFHRRANTEFIIRRQSPLPSRQLFADQSKTVEDLDKTPSAENPTRRKLEEGAKLLTGWFQGKPEPVNVEVVSQSESTGTPTMDAREFYGSPRVPTSRAQKRMTAPSPLKQVTSSNPFSFFGLKRQETRLELPEPADDELLNLDIAAALFPTASTNLSEQEALDTLRSNAENVIKRLQAAYKQRTFALHEALADKSEKQEELEETRTRVGSLKIQLDGMVEKVDQQEKAMSVMAEELEQERQLRRREDEARLRSIRLIRSSDDESISDLGADLQTPKRSMKRASNATYASDSGFDSGDESLAESIFSRREGLESPTSTVAPSPRISQVTLPAQVTFPAPVSTPLKEKESKSHSQASTPRQSAYDRVIKGIASSWMNNSKCGICHGVPSSEAWSVLGILKEENKGLKERLGELEMVIDDCLCMIAP
ncbi:hypothetical protein BDV28DRAFT_138158 [Aspergillus coremiiformis]|uniref:Uncharacterized protein n=1 Tax=Aspergillus coremiiformis TaxID=138285 RepID=A0A5N6Z1U9_9EURO|nr:hypothetical protein BDV28DRAFT_138158 [Aspergillus coremiiformis]